MSSYRSWQEQGAADDKFHETHILTVFPLDKGFLVTMRSHMAERQPPFNSFGHYEVTFFASLAQGKDIAEALLAHIGSKQLDQSDPSGPDDPLPGSP